MALPLDIFKDETEADILIIKAQALKFFKEGKTIMNYGVAGRTVGKAMIGNPEEILAACNYALKVINSTEYGDAPVDRYVFRL